MRKTLEETWRYLEASGEDVPRDAAGRPFVPAQMPGYDDDEPLGFSYFRYHLEDADNSNLTLPRTHFARSLLLRVNFANTDLSESRMCWNDFEQCDFSGADLSRCDMRASNFKDCKFERALLGGADLRQSSFENCNFTGADLAGAIVESGNARPGNQIGFAEEQQAAVIWTDDCGPEPPGG